MVKPPLLVATRSAGKQPEIKRILSDIPYRLVFPDDVGLYEKREEDTLEDAGSFDGNARRKAEYFSRLARLPTVADDSGLEVLSLRGAPGVRSRRFALPQPGQDQDAANNAELLRRLAGAAPERRRARYRCSVAYLRDPAALPVTFDGICTGVILEEPRGSGGFGYDPLFLSDELGVSFGEADADAKHGVSHRGRAFRAFADWLKSQPPQTK
jgi:XTP/dITP diphosphohydrolase